MAGDGKDGDKSGSSEMLGDDPFSIHHSDNPTAVLVSPPLNGDNYGSWLHAITMALRAKNKIGCNDQVGSWILNSVSDEIRSSILYADSARTIWIDLSERFSQSNAPKIYQFQQSISSLKQENLSVSAYFTKLKSLWDGLNSLQAFQPCTYGSGKGFSDRLQQDRAIEFLQGLHDRFTTILSQILLMEPFPSATKMYSLVRQEEKQQEIHSLLTPMPDAVALNIAAKSNNYTPNRIVTGGNHPHLGGGNCPSSSAFKPKYPCDHCGRDVHSKERCFKIIGYPTKCSESPNLSTKSKHKVTPPVITPEQYNKLLAMLSTANINFSSHLAGIALSIPPISV
ncbi:uncharacterized protein LOC132278280 [Cornus florida]|uniref:uncharacterized protein LOC132278280 n=1 Tax=Cornus florida TaxID=4283 RepID=UPI0028A1C313|nr:uncharacterized protein LOC132278280 [Cornus florida]